MSTSATAPNPQEFLVRFVLGFWNSRAMYAAAKLGFADLLVSGPKTADELAAATGTHGPSVYRLMRALCNSGVFVQDDQQRFSLNAYSELMRSDIPESMRYVLLTELGEEHFPAWGNLMHSVRTGEIAFDNHHGKDIWQYYAENPEQGRIFERAMSGLTLAFDRAIVSTYDFSKARKLVDIGGSHGTLIRAVLQQNPNLSAVLFDAPPVIEAARNAGKVAGLPCELVAGDFFKQVPEGGDLYTLKFIIHDWNDDQSRTILRNVAQAMTPDGSVLLLELLLAPDNAFSNFMDLNMLVMTGGRERTEAEYSALFSSAGLKLHRVHPTPSPISIIEAVKG